MGAGVRVPDGAGVRVTAGVGEAVADVGVASAGDGDPALALDGATLVGAAAHAPATSAHAIATPDTRIARI